MTSEAYADYVEYLTLNPGLAVPCPGLSTMPGFPHTGISGRLHQNHERNAGSWAPPQTYKIGISRVEAGDLHVF